MNRIVWKAAFIKSLPVMMGYLTMGTAFGILLSKETGLNAFWAALICGTTISGAMQFAEVDLLNSGVSLVEIALLTLLINSRYAMYGFSLLDRFRGQGWKKAYLIFSLTDETYALQVENKVPPGENPVAYCLAIAFLDHMYWILGGILGAVIGSAIVFNARGVDFAMTALFLVVLTDQCRERENRIPALIGAGTTLLCRFVFGPGQMMIPAMLLMIGLFLLLRKHLDSPTSSGAGSGVSPENEEVLP